MEYKKKQELIGNLIESIEEIRMLHKKEGELLKTVEISYLMMQLWPEAFDRGSASVRIEGKNGLKYVDRIEDAVIVIEDDSGEKRCFDKFNVNKILFIHVVKNCHCREQIKRDMIREYENKNL